MKLLDFNLEKALKNPERVVFEDGSKVVDFKYFPTASTPFNLFVQNKYGCLFNYTKNGVASSNSFLSIKLLPLTKTYYYCLFVNNLERLCVSDCYSLKDDMYGLMKKYNCKILQEHSYTVEIPE